MTLAQIITQIGNGTYERTAKLDPFLEVQIHEEFGTAKRFDSRRKLFDDVRKLNDIMIEKYLRVKTYERQNMAEAYAREACFRGFIKIEEIPNETRERLEKELGENIHLLLQISNDSKAIKMKEIRLLSRTS